jgi:hypothetical protein
MKKQIISSLSLIAAVVMLSSCDKEYTCKCTYVARSSGSAAGQPNKDETSNVKGKSSTLADVNCKMNENKYWSQGFDGNCGID